MSMNMTVGRRVSLGFGALVLICVLLGGIAVFRMREATEDSRLLAEEYVPEVEVATDLRGAVNRTMYAMRGYSLSEEERFFEDAQREIKLVGEHRSEAEALSQEAHNLKALAGQVAEAKEAEVSYSGLMTTTRETVGRLNEARGALDESAAAYMKNCSAFLAAQNAAFKRDLAERTKKVEIISRIVNLGTSVRVMNFKPRPRTT